MAIENDTILNFHEVLLLEFTLCFVLVCFVAIFRDFIVSFDCVVKNLWGDHSFYFPEMET